MRNICALKEVIYKDGAIIPFGDGCLSLRVFYRKELSHVKIWMRSVLKEQHIIKTGTYRPVVKENSDYVLEIHAPQMSEKEIGEAVNKWFREYARGVLSNKAEAYAKIMNVSYNRIAIKEQKTRWGSCSSKGNLNFNWKLILMPEFMQNYVVVHELAHLKQMNHSKAFWMEVEKVLPYYKEYVKWQREHEGEFVRY